MKRHLTLLAAAILLLSLTGCGERQKQHEESAEAGEFITEVITPQEDVLPPPPPDPIREIMDTMSVEEKVGQLFLVRMPVETEVSDVQTYHLGGYVVFWRNIQDKTPQEMADLLTSCQQAADIPLFLATDEEGGSVVRFSLSHQLRSSAYASPRSIYQAGGLEALAANSAEKDAFLQQFGINVNLAPVADSAADENSFIFSRTVGNSPEETARCIRTMVEQMRSDGMGSCLKHFPGYGNNLDTHTGIAIDTRPYEQFEAEDFLPFQAGIEAGAPFVLVSHNIVNCMDADFPASLSPAVHLILRRDLGFDGLIITDDLTMGAVAQYVANGQAAVQAIRAGNDMIITTDYPTQIAQVLAALEDGTLDMSTVDTACRRILQVKMEMGLLTRDT